ncbi:tripartite tricarboxylate transporter substrate binding protein [Variovorax guangxiensis]|uniref:Bug family tripartite tricarboxylate transporter substrate binding protein n=1 Tax=Variovorax guangxiensis TaxID=1775474 RepID=UPI002866ECAB|nr:tripartite tricarboxylate transporter substrate binding protein [Variovorax guangxiensis]MDR6860197.1 tripartite-type tricarboxylate transporter receptor subunit TctC [Variovorax guangxiensis]
MCLSLLLGRRAAIALSLLSINAAFSPAQAQSTENRPLRLIVPNQAGSGVDAVARSMSSALTAAFGRPIVIENVPGSGGLIGTQQIVRAPKDGSVLGMVSSNHVINPFIYKHVPFDAIKDITPISVIASSPLVLVVNTETVRAKTTREFITELKASPKKFSYGSAGNGTVLHLAAEYFLSEAGVQALHIPYKGTGNMITDIIGGQVHFGMLPLAVAAPQIKAGKLRALAVSTSSRSPALPDVPTVAESGIPNFEFDSWVAIIGPAGLPPAVIASTYQKLKEALATKEIHDSFAAQGFTSMTTTPEQTQPFLISELEKHGKLVKRSGATAD